jgi:ribosomal protein L12E/L44/L45/RPP1/RPP2
VRVAVNGLAKLSVDEPKAPPTPSPKVEEEEKEEEEEEEEVEEMVRAHCDVRGTTSEM